MVFQTKWKHLLYLFKQKKKQHFTLLKLVDMFKFGQIPEADRTKSPYEWFCFSPINRNMQQIVFNIYEVKYVFNSWNI